MIQRVKKNALIGTIKRDEFVGAVTVNIMLLASLIQKQIVENFK